MPMDAKEMVRNVFEKEFRRIRSRQGVGNKKKMAEGYGRMVTHPSSSLKGMKIPRRYFQIYAHLN